MAPTLRLGLAAALLATSALGAQAQELRIGLQEDPDVLDPDQSRSFVGRIVYASLCDKLVDITPDLEIVPMLATDWEWSEDGTSLTMNLREGVTFHDGTPFDAEAVAYNIDRSLTLPESRRKSEIASVTGTEVIDENTIRIDLAEPDATLLAQLADRAGMMISPAAAEEAGAEFGANPVCSGPFQFEQRVAQDRIVLSRFEDYWDAERIHFDTVTFLPIPDGTVRLANLRSGELDMIERLASTDRASAVADEGLQVEEAVSLGYQAMTVNVGNGERADNPLGQDPRVRKAFSLSIDREALNQVVFEGAFQPGNQPFPPGSPWYDETNPVPARDVEAARALLDEAGLDRVPVQVQVTNDPEDLRIAQVMQAMVAEAGFDMEIVAKEFATLLEDQTAGSYQASRIGWSGRVDPDGNIHQFVTCEGGINDAGYCNEEVDRHLNEARRTTDQAARKESYDAAQAILSEELPIVYLFHETWIWALDDAVEGFVPSPDGMIRLQDVRLAE